MNEKTYAVALAGLLQDVGQFAQWAAGKWGEAPVGGIELASRYVPTPWRAACCADEVMRVVALADWLAAGARRADRGPRPRQLRTIFSSLTVEEQALAPEEARYWPLKPLALEAEMLFPQAALSEEARAPAYEALGAAFVQDAEALAQAHQKAAAFPAYLESLLLLLQRYAWCVPALPDVSLYDHSRMTAALAVCLKDQSEEMLKALEGDLEQSTEPVALLVGGDISGVQDFIYTITSRGATSALRGRSFYLQLLTEALSRYVLRELDLPVTNLIYQGGGNFYLLARPSDAARLGEIQRQISWRLLAHHRGELYLALEGAPLAARDFFAGRIAAQWDALRRRQQQAKQRRFAELGAELAQLFVPQGMGGDESGECSVCGREHPDIAADAETNTRKCQPCRDFEALGKDLRQASYLWLREVPPTSLPETPLSVKPGGWQAALGTFGLEAGVSARVEMLPQPDAGVQLVLALNDAAVRDLAPGPRTVVGRRLLVNVTPTLTRADIDALRDRQLDAKELAELHPDTVKPFSVLELQARGTKRLGVLRMDVDNLGLLFSEGFGKAATLSRVAALSFAIGVYFEGWVGQLAERANRKHGDVLYSIYSGGDDLFFVGAWDVVVELAREIRVDLGRFAAGHPGIHASGGIALVGGKYPLYQAAADAGEAEHAAKAHPGKDAVTFLGQTLPWAKFGLEGACAANTETVHGLRHHLEQLVLPEKEDGLGATASLLRRLTRLQLAYEMALKARRQAGTEVNRQGEVQGVWGPWMWRGYYALKRMAEQERAEKERAIAALAERLHEDHFNSIDWIGLAARWVELLLRDL